MISFSIAYRYITLFHYLKLVNESKCHALEWTSIYSTTETCWNESNFLFWVISVRACDIHIHKLKVSRINEHTYMRRYCFYGIRSALKTMSFEIFNQNIFQLFLLISKEFYDIFHITSVLTICQYFLVYKILISYL